MFFRKVSFVATFLLIGPLVCAAGQERLTAIAERENSRRKTIRQEVPTFTNRDLPFLSRARVSSSVIKQEDRVKDSPIDPGRKATKRESEVAWMVRIQEAREELAAAVNRHHVLQLRQNQLRNLFLNTPDQAVRQSLEEGLAKGLEELRQVAEEEQAAREAWERMQAEALRAGFKTGKEPSNLVSTEFPVAVK